MRILLTILSVTSLMLLGSVESQYSRSRTSSTMSKYYGYFCKVRGRLIRSEASVLTKFEQFFYKNFGPDGKKIKSKKVNFKFDENLDTLVNADNSNEAIKSISFGTKTNNSFVKLMISGAKGKSKKNGSKDISTLALSEIVENESMGVAIAYASMISPTDFVLDAKVDQKKMKLTKNNKGQVIITACVGNKYTFKTIRTVVGVTKMYRLVIGVDYIKFEVSLLVAGASVKDDSVISKSIIKISTYLISGQSKAARHNLGIFTSENKTVPKKSLSTHFGLLKVNKKDVTEIQTTEGASVANKDKLQTDAVYNEFKRLSEKSRRSK